jgi:hypothetical protein
MSKANRESNSLDYVPERVCHAFDELVTAAMTDEAAVRYWFRKLEGHDFFEYPDAEKPLDLDEYLWKYHQLPPGGVPSQSQLAEYAQYASSKSQGLPLIWQPLFDYLAARHVLSESQIRAMTLKEIATLLGRDYSSRERRKEDEENKQKLDLILLPDRREAKRKGRFVKFRGRNVAWNILVHLYRRYPDYYPTLDLGHAACNEGWQGEDSGMSTMYNHIYELNQMLKPLGVRANHTRSSGYLLEECAS